MTTKIHTHISIQDYLKLMSGVHNRMGGQQKHASAVYRSIDDLLLAEAVPYVATEPNSEERSVIECALARLLEADHDFGIARSCFRSSFLLHSFGNQFTYVEGYASSSIIPTLHAWCLYDGRILVDPVYRTTRRWGIERRQSMADAIIGTPPEHTEYFGVHFPAEWIEENIVRAGCSYLDDWEHGWPFIQHGLPWKKGK